MSKYTDGFKAGYKEGYADGQTNKEPASFPYPWTPEPIEKPVKTQCPKCGLELVGAMLYVCPNMGCPVFPQVIC